MAYQSAGDNSATVGQRNFVPGEGYRSQRGCHVLRRQQYGTPTIYLSYDTNCIVVVQEEEFDEDEGIYDELNLDEEEEKFGLHLEDEGLDDSDEQSEGELMYRLFEFLFSYLRQTCLLGHLIRSTTMRRA